MQHNSGPAPFTIQCFGTCANFISDYFDTTQIVKYFQSMIRGNPSRAKCRAPPNGSRGGGAGWATNTVYSMREGGTSNHTKYQAGSGAVWGFHRSTISQHPSGIFFLIVGGGQNFVPMAMFFFGGGAITRPHYKSEPTIGSHWMGRPAAWIARTPLGRWTSRWPGTPMGSAPSSSTSSPGIP